MYSTGYAIVSSVSYSLWCQKVGLWLWPSSFRQRAKMFSCKNASLNGRLIANVRFIVDFP